VLAERRGGEGVAALGGGGARDVAGRGDEPRKLSGLLPGRILPSDYLRQPAWRRRVEVLRDASRQLRTFNRA